MDQNLAQHLVAIVFDGADAAWDHHSRNGGWVFSPTNPKARAVWFAPIPSNTLTKILDSGFCVGNGTITCRRANLHGEAGNG